MTKTKAFAFNSGVRATYIPDAFGSVGERIDFSLEGVVYYSLKHTRVQKENTWTLERYAQGSERCRIAMATELSRLFPAEYIWFLPVGLTDPDYCPWIEGYLVNRFIDWMEDNLRPQKVGGITRANPQKVGGITRANPQKVGGITRANPQKVGGITRA